MDDEEVNRSFDSLSIKDVEVDISQVADSQGFDTSGGIFDDDMIEKYLCADGKQRWRCKWCDTTFAGWNATKAVCHVVKESKTMNIKPCRAKISNSYMVTYKQIYMKLIKKRDRTAVTNSHLERSIASHNDISAATLDSKRRSLSSTISTKRNKLSSYSNDDAMSGRFKAL